MPTAIRLISRLQDLDDVDASLLTDGYTLGFSGGKVVGKKGSGWFNAGDYAGGTNGAAGQIAQAVADAAAAITATRGATAYIPAGLWDCAGGGSITGAVAAIPRALPNGLRILFDTGSIVRLSANIPRLFDFAKVADYDWFQHILVDGDGMTVDANMVGGQHHVVIGTYRSASRQTRINVNDLLVRGVNVINARRDPNTAANHRLGFWISVNHPASGETQTVIQNVTYRDCTMAGGNGGFACNGNVASGPCNVFHDNILYENCRWDSGVIPTAHFGSTGFHVGGSGFGKRCRLVNCHGFNAGDDAFEIDSMDVAILTDCTGTNSYSEDFLLTNQRQVSAGGSDVQWASMKNCHAYKIDSPGANANGFLFGDTTYEYGRITLDTCRRYVHHLGTEQSWSSGGLGLSADGVLVRELVVKNFVYDELNISHADTASSDPSAIRINLTSQRARLELDARVHIQGNRGGTGVVRWRGVHIQGTDLRVDARVRVDNEVTGLSAGSTRPVALGDIGSLGSIRGKLSLTIERWASDSTARGIWSDTSYSIPDKLVVEYSGFAQFAGLAGNDVYHVSPPGQQSKIVYGPGNRWRNGAPAAANITVGASPFVYQNINGAREDIYVRGGTVSLIELSRTGVFAGEQFDVGMVAGRVAALDNADYLRVTYTAAPTMVRCPQG